MNDWGAWASILIGIVMTAGARPVGRALARTARESWGFPKGAEELNRAIVAALIIGLFFILMGVAYFLS